MHLCQNISNIICKKYLRPTCNFSLLTKRFLEVKQKLRERLLRAICGSPVDRKAQWWGPQGIDCINSKKDH